MSLPTYLYELYCALYLTSDLGYLILFLILLLIIDRRNRKLRGDDWDDYEKRLAAWEARQQPFTNDPDPYLEEYNFYMEEEEYLHRPPHPYERVLFSYNGYIFTYEQYDALISAAAGIALYSLFALFAFFLLINKLEFFGWITFDPFSGLELPPYLRRKG